KTWAYPVDVAHMDRVYTWAMLNQFSKNAANVRRLDEEKECVPWVCRYCPDITDEVPILSRGRYREILRHLWLRGAATMQIFNALRPKHPSIAIEELEDAVAVYDEMLQYRAILEKGTLMNTDSPAVMDDRAVWSGLKTKNEAVIRAFTQGNH